MPLCFEIINGLLKLSSASKVAFTTLCGFEDPWDLESTFWTPTASKTVLTAPPAITPVPSVAGLINTLAPPNLPFCSCGSVPLSIGILTKFSLHLQQL